MITSPRFSSVDEDLVWVPEEDFNLLFFSLVSSLFTGFFLLKKPKTPIVAVYAYNIYII